MSKLWFRAKRYGWGWYPSSWEGWLFLSIALTIHIAVVVLFTHWMNKYNIQTGQDLFLPIIGLSAWILVFIGVIILVCYKKGEKPGWHWGDK